MARTPKEIIKRLTTLSYSREPVIPEEEMSFSTFQELLRQFESKGPPYHRPLFRGQADACWDLRPTLERNEMDGRLISCRDYRLAVVRGFEAVFGETGLRRTSYLLEFNKLLNEPGERKSKEMYSNAPSRGTYAYLRHIGVSSPLIDWSHDLRTALWFARDTEDESKAAAVYLVPSNLVEGMNDWRMDTFGWNYFSHVRHILQNSEYTFAVERNPEDEFDPILRFNQSKAGFVHLLKVKFAPTEFLEIDAWIKNDQNLTLRTVYENPTNEISEIEQILVDDINKRVFALSNPPS